MKKISMIKPYLHLVHYYETDQMQIVHHSNYIRWFEESRCDYLKQIGLPYHKLEEMGIISPVVEMNCSYKSMVRFDDTVMIVPKITKFSAVRFEVSYQIFDATTNELRAVGSSKHCFIGRDTKPLNVKKIYPEIYEKFSNLVTK